MSFPGAGETKNKRIICSQTGRLAANFFHCFGAENDNYFLFGVEKKKTG